MMEIYVSADVEADGPIPGQNSMLSVGAAAYTADKQLLGTFSRNLVQLPDATTDPDTMRWWQTEGKEAWHVCRHDPQDPARVMNDYVEWVRSLPGKPTFVGYPVGYDFMFVYWYMMRFVGSSPFSHSGIDIKTYAMALMDTTYNGSSKKNMPKRWFDKHTHTHVAVDDAIEQGALFCNMLAERKRRLPRL